MCLAFETSVFVQICWALSKHLSMICNAWMSTHGCQSIANNPIQNSLSMILNARMTKLGSTCMTIRKDSIAQDNIRLGVGNRAIRNHDS